MTGPAPEYPRLDGEVSVADLRYPVGNVLRYGAKGDGVSNDRPAILSAITSVRARGGGLIDFPQTPSNTYRVEGTGFATVPVPMSNARGETLATRLQYHFFLFNSENLHFRGHGAMIVSTVPSGGEIFLFDGAVNLVWEGIGLQSVTGFDPVTRAPSIAGMEGLAFTSTARDSERITIRQFAARDVYTGVYTFGDPAGAYRVRGIRIEDMIQEGGEYGIAAHDNGDLMTFDRVRIRDINARAYFVYGVDGHLGQFEVDGAVRNQFGLFLIKAYNRDTSNITIQFRSRHPTNGGIYQLVLQSQHDPGRQPQPCRVRNLCVDMDDTGNTGSSIGFDYYQGSVQQTESAHNLFDNIVLKGRVQDGSTVVTTVVQKAGARGYLNIDDLRANAGRIGILEDRGFYRSDHQTYTPVLTFGGAESGIRYRSRSGEFYVVAGVCFAVVKFRLSSKGHASGAASISLPVSSTQVRPIPYAVVGEAFDGMIGLNAPMTGYVATLGVLQDQTNIGLQDLTDVNFTDAADLMLSFAYSI